ncbi:chromate transporter [Peptostreptococcus russellii]|uniref:Chromate transporter n=1 Tax=Peptostreptococcus russellii TaxID=215200 RepID=A0A1H8IJA3_9FIRM|nr:chromate transporter [Peptostreptococcus russellii]SEN68960.1 chromate transporter [Peptostreptococcus russellii]
MDSKKISYKSLFITFFKINMFTFGGGYTIVPVIRDEFVNKKKLIDDDEMLDIVAIAQSGPGPMAINTSILTGYRLIGWKGALVCLLASVLPCLIIISIMYYVYNTISKNSIVKAALGCMSGAISAVLFITVFQMAKKALVKHKIFGSILMFSAFSAAYFTNINTIYIILLSGMIGLIVFSLVEEDKIK